jgi:hypothetical protein
MTKHEHISTDGKVTVITAKVLAVLANLGQEIAVARQTNNPRAGLQAVEKAIRCVGPDNTVAIELIRKDARPFFNEKFDDHVDKYISKCLKDPEALNGQKPQANGSAKHTTIELKAKPKPQTKAAEIKLPPLTVEQWKGRDLPPPDRLMGEWLTTTSRVLFVAPTGLGKTNTAMQIAYNASLGKDFLHWKGARPCRVLYIDGEMSRRLLRDKMVDCERRTGEASKTFFALSHEDVIEQGFGPLNTPQGQAFLDRFIEAIGGVDLIVFDSIMCLIVGEMKEEEPWAKTLPWILSLTRRQIGQLWIHHTGHDETRGYGTKTREWQLDCVIHLTKVDDVETDISFTLEFGKARERRPDNRADFRTVNIKLLNDRWTCDGMRVVKPAAVTDTAQRFLDALHNVLAGDRAKGVVEIIDGHRAAHVDAWAKEAMKLGLLDPDKPDSARSLLSKYRRDLVAKHRIGCSDKWCWDAISSGDQTPYIGKQTPKSETKNHGFKPPLKPETKTETNRNHNDFNDETKRNRK